MPTCRAGEDGNTGIQLEQDETGDREDGVRNYPLQDLCLAEFGRISSLRCGFDPTSATGVTALPTYGLGFLIGYTTQSLAQPI